MHANVFIKNCGKNNSLLVSRMSQYIFCVARADSNRWGTEGWMDGWEDGGRCMNG